METAALHELAKSIVDYGITVVVTGLAIAGVVIVFRWGMKRADRALDKKELREERQTMAMEDHAKGMREIAAVVKPLAETVARIDRKQEEHGSALAKILEHLFGHDEKGKDAP